MNKTWLSVIIAALFEVGWEWGATVIAIIVSFTLMILASRSLPVGTVYAVFVGLGTAGTVLAEIILFGAPVQIGKMALIVVLLLGVIGLKMLSKEKEREVE
jgi:paired small multidrug resistance pump